MLFFFLTSMFKYVAEINVWARIRASEWDEDIITSLNIVQSGVKKKYKNIYFEYSIVQLRNTDYRKVWER